MRVTDTIPVQRPHDDARSTRPSASALAIDNGLFEAVGDDVEIMRLREPKTTVVDLNRRTVIPGSTTATRNLIRGGLNYNLELRWDGGRLARRRAQNAARAGAPHPAPQWVRVVGGWSEFQFAERRMPTLAEIKRRSARYSGVRAACLRARDV